MKCLQHIQKQTDIMRSNCMVLEKLYRELDHTRTIPPHSWKWIEISISETSPASRYPPPKSYQWTRWSRLIWSLRIILLLECLSEWIGNCFPHVLESAYALYTGTDSTWESCFDYLQLWDTEHPSSWDTGENSKCKRRFIFWEAYEHTTSTYKHCHVRHRQQQLDPIGWTFRWRRAIRRRVYGVQIPNELHNYCIINNIITKIRPMLFSSPKYTTR